MAAPVPAAPARCVPPYLRERRVNNAQMRGLRIPSWIVVRRNGTGLGCSLQLIPRVISETFARERERKRDWEVEDNRVMITLDEDGAF